jgi:hypothetical protein
MQTLQDLVTAFRLYGVCEDCQRVEAVDLAKLIEKEGGDYPVNRIRMRLHCRLCKQRTQALRIVYVGPEGRASGFRYARAVKESQSTPMSDQIHPHPRIPLHDPQSTESG